MIKLTFAKPYRSIESLPTIELPDFTVLTGVNGAGKTHLFEAIAQGYVSVEGIQGIGIGFYNWGNLTPGESNTVDPLDMARRRAWTVNHLAEGFANARQEYVAATEAILPLLGPQATEETLLEPADEHLNHVRQAGQRGADTIRVLHQQIGHLNTKIQKFSGGAEHMLPVLRKAALAKKKALVSLSEQEIEELLPLGWEQRGLFQQELTNRFAEYYGELERNHYHVYRNTAHGESNPVLSDVEFVARFGPAPWELFNEIVEEAGIKYRVTQPRGPADVSYEARLINTVSSRQVAFRDLSSGERIIMSFALCVYNAQRPSEVISKPKILLLDEVDAPLHPSLTKSLMRVLDRVIVGKHGIKVLMSTHSPAAVALAPNESLYLLERQPQQIVRTSRESAIQTLTSGYIAVTENTRVVLTEASRDKRFFGAAYERLVEQGKLKLVPNLAFVQVGNERDDEGGGKNEVVRWAAKLPNVGLSQVYGLLDRDDGNKETRNVKVLRRHSVENYLLDPLVYAVLMNLGCHEKVGKAPIANQNFYELVRCDSKTLQAIADSVCKAVQKARPEDVGSKNERFEVEYLCGVKLKVPTWIRDCRGHTLEKAYREAFKKIVGNGFVGLTGNGCNACQEMLCSRLPEFIPNELVEVLAGLQT